MPVSFLPHVVQSLGKYWPGASANCGLPHCPVKNSLWRRIWRHRNGVRFDGVLYCHLPCLEIVLREELLRLQDQTLPVPPPNRIPLGLLMVARGKLTHAEVSAALEAQRRARHGNIGEWVEKLGFASEQDVTAALGLQWGCPVASSLSNESNATAHHLPSAILEDFLMWPIHWVPATNTLYIACGKRVDHGVLSAIEKMLGCRTQPCVGSPKSIASRIERLRQEGRAGQIEFHSMRDTSEMVRIAISYIGRLGPQEIRATRAGDFIWLLLKNLSTSMNLVFHLRSESQAAGANLSIPA